MPLKNLSYREVRRKLIAAGFTEVSRKGSHVKFAKQQKLKTLVAIVPHHAVIATGTLRSITKQAGLTTGEFESL